MTGRVSRRRYLGAMVGAGLAAGATGTAGGSHAQSASPVVWTVSVGALAASGLLWDLRLSLVQSDAIPVQALGMVCCVLGAELYNFGTLPPQVTTATEALLRWLPLVEVAPLTRRLLTNTALVLVGQAAFVVGVAIALLFLWSHETS